MLVKMLTLEAGPNGTFNPGDERPVSDDLGHQMVAAGYAVEIKPESLPTAVIETQETVAPAEPVIPQPQPVRRDAPARARKGKK